MSNRFHSLKLNKCGGVRSKKAKTHTVNEKCPDDDIVAALPDDWIPRRSGPILANYLKLREQEHQNIHADISNCAAEVNNLIDNKIRTLAENLFAQINQNQLDMDCVVKTCDMKSEPLRTELLGGAHKNIKDLYYKRIDDIATFKREASVVERERADNLKVILRDKFQRLVSNGQKTPSDLLHDFDARIYEINQQLLSNSRAFIELEAQLRVQVDASVSHARCSFNQLNLGISVVYRKRVSHSAIRNTKEEKIAQRRSFSSDRIHETSEFSAVNSIIGNVEELDICVKRLVQAYRTAVLKVYAGYCSKLGLLEKDLFSHQYGDDASDITLKESYDFQNIMMRPLQRLSYYFENISPSITLLEATGIDVAAMQKSLLNLGECLQTTYSILHDTGHLWDSHILRTALAQKITIAAVEDLLTSHDTAELTYEVPISIAMEQLRCATDVDKLEQQYENIKTMLTRIGEIYLQHSEAELGRLEEYMNFPTIMAKILLSEFNLFMEKYPRNSSFTGIPSATSLLPGPPRRKTSSLRLPLPRAIIQTELQGIALKNWRDGFLDSFAGNIPLVPEELRHQAQLWVEERSASLHMRFSMKMISHSIRMERINAARELRLAELRYHDCRLQSHLDAIYNLVEKLSAQAAEFLAIDAPSLYPIVTWTDRLKTGINEVLAEESPNHETRRLKMLSYAKRLPIHRRLFEESLDKALLEYKQQLEHRFQEARISNVRFITNIKLFDEGGNYAPQEALKTSTALIKASEILETCSYKAIDALHNRRSQLLANVDNLVLPLIRIVEDTTKLCTKSNIRQQDKRKSQGRKK